MSFTYSAVCGPWSLTQVFLTNKAPMPFLAFLTEMIEGDRHEVSSRDIASRP